MGVKMFRKIGILFGAALLVLTTAGPATAGRDRGRTPAPAPSGTTAPRCGIVAEAPRQTQVIECPDGRISVLSWSDEIGAWYTLYQTYKS